MKPETFAARGAGALLVVLLASSCSPPDSPELAVQRDALSAGSLRLVAGYASGRGRADGVGAAARFNSPTGVALDADGNLYVAEPSNYAIRKVTPAGAVVTFAGTPGVNGTADGVGTAAGFAYPTSVAVDAGGNVYVGDSNRIRKITPGGAVSTLASGVQADRLTVDASGTVYVAGNQCIQKVTSSGTVTLLAGLAGTTGNADGTGDTARFNTPRGLAVDSSGNVYVADSYNHVIRKITPGGGVTTIAGSPGLPGKTDGTGAGARFTYPDGITIDWAGNLFVADTSSYAIRRVTPSGVVTTLAGGTYNSYGIDGVGAAARFAGPFGIAVDVAGNVFVADRDNTIRKVTASGAATTFAGASPRVGLVDSTVGASARFYRPLGVAVDAAGNAYVADSYNYRIRKVTAAGAVTTLAGGGAGSADGTGLAARFSTPYGVAVDTSGNVFVADTGNHTIRKVTSAGVVTTIAGTAGQTGSVDGVGAAARFYYPYGVAVDGAGNLYVADGMNYTVRKIAPDGTVTTLAGTARTAGSTDGTGAAARFGVLYDVAVDGAGNVFAADSYYTIRKITAAGVVTTIAGTAYQRGNVDGVGPAARFRSPRSLSLDAGGNLYVTDQDNGAVRRITPAGVVTTAVGVADVAVAKTTTGALPGSLAFPWGVAVSSTGKIYVTVEDALLASDNGLAIETGKTGPVELQAGQSIQLGAAGGAGGYTWTVYANNSGATITSDGLYIAGPRSATDYVRLTDATGAYIMITIRSFGPSDGGVSILAGAPSGKGRFDGIGPAARFLMPVAVSVDAAGNAYVGDLNNHTIRKITPAGAVTTLAGTPGTSGTVDGTGAAARFNGPQSVASDAAGNVYVADSSNCAIRKVTPAGVVTTFAGALGICGSVDGTGPSARFYVPTAVTTDASGNVYVVANQTIRKITAAGVVTTLAGTPGVTGSADGTGAAARFYWPYALTTDAAGNVIVADSSNHTIRMVTQAGVVTTIAGSPGVAGVLNGTGSAARFYYPMGVAADAAGNVFVSDQYGQTIRKIAPGGVVTTVAGSAYSAGAADGTGAGARFYNLRSLAIDGAGNLYVADAYNNAIRKVTPSGVVTTLAGPLVPLPGAVDAAGAAARFYGPTSIALDAAGNAYVADSGNQRIRKVTPSGVVTTLAGGPGSGSVDGTGTAARFNSPSGVAVDAAGTVYVADTYNHTLRKVTSGGVVTTLAGTAGLTGSVDGTGAGALFNYPTSVAVDSSGNVYVADRSNHVIRKVTAGGVVTTFAGSAALPGTVDGTGSAARFAYPYAIAVDGSGTLYVAEESSTVRKVTSAGVVTTLAGAANQRGAVDGVGAAARFALGSAMTYCGGNGISVDAAGNVYVTDAQNSAVRKISPSGAVTTVVGVLSGTSAANVLGPLPASLAFPSGVAAGKNGALYVAVDSAVLVAVQPLTITAGVSGTLDVLAGSTVSLGATGGLGDYTWSVTSSTTQGAVTTAGLYTAGYATGTTTVTVTDARGRTASLTIRTLPATGTLALVAGAPYGFGAADGTGTNARFTEPLSMTRDGAGNLYVADYSNHVIRKVSAGGVVTTFAGKAGEPGDADGTGAAARFRAPIGIAWDGIANLYVSDTGNHTIRRITSAGVVTTIAGASGQPGSVNGTTGRTSRFNQPAGIYVPQGGYIYIADYGNHAIRRWYTTDGAVTTFAGLAGAQGTADGAGTVARFSYPRDLIGDGAYLYVADQGNATIRQINTSTAAVTTWAGAALQYGSVDGTGTAARFNQPIGITVDAAHNLYVADGGNSTIRKITTGRVVTTILGQVGVQGAVDGRGNAALFSGPGDVVADPAGELYVADSGNNAIRKVSTLLDVTTYAGTPRRYGTADGAGAAARFYAPWGAAVDAAGNVFVADTANNTIRKITPAGVVSTFAGQAGVSGSADGTGTAAQFRTPSGLAFDPSGNLYVADSWNETIRKITPAGVVTTIAGTPGAWGSVDGVGAAARFNWPRGIAVDASGIVYVADTDNMAIRKITPDGTVTTLAGKPGTSGITDGLGAAALFRSPTGVTVDRAGNVYVADNGNHTIRKVTPAGLVTTLAGRGLQPGSADGAGTAARFNLPLHVAIDGGDNLYVADQGNSAIRKVTPGGDVTTVVGVSAPGTLGTFTGSLPASIAGVRGVAVDRASGNTYVIVNDAVLLARFPLRVTSATDGVVSVEPGLATQLTASGGTGPYVWTLAVNNSGATITPDGVYTAGTAGGTDTIVVTDATGFRMTVEARPVTSVAAGQGASDWLSARINPDGSWGASRDVAFLETTEAALALAAWQRRGPAYRSALSFLENHRPANVDYRARRILALQPSGDSLAADLAELQVAQVSNAVAPGNGGLGLTRAYQGAPLDTALALQAYQLVAPATNVTAPIAYLKASQQLDGGWAVGQESGSDPATTAHVILALLPRRAGDASLATPIAKGLALLDAKVTPQSRPATLALAALAHLRNDPSSSRSAALRQALIARRSSDGSWGNDVYSTALALRALSISTGRVNSNMQLPVTVADPILRASIARALGLHDMDALTRGDLANLTRLDIAGLGVSDLTGLEWATNLTYLDARYNQIQSFAPVNGLTQATVLRYGNPGFVATWALYGADELGSVIDKLVFDAQAKAVPGVENLGYRRGGSALAERQMTVTGPAGALGAQSIGPMTRNLLPATLASHATWKPTIRNVIGLGALAWVSSTKSWFIGMDVPLDPADWRRAAPNDPTSPTYTQLLEVVLAGVDGSGSVAACSDLRRVQALADLAYYTEVPVIDHLYRLDDNSDATDVIKEKLRVTRFCNGAAPGILGANGNPNLNDQDLDPIRRPCPLPDPSRAVTACTNLATGLPCTGDQPNCTQGLVVSISAADPGAPSVAATLVSRVTSHPTGASMGYAPLAAAKADPGARIPGFNSLSAAENLIRTGDWLLSYRVFLGRGPADETRQGTAPAADLINDLAVTDSPPVPAGGAKRVTAEANFFKYVTDPAGSATPDRTPGRCNTDPVLRSYGFFPCMSTCTATPTATTSYCHTGGAVDYPPSESPAPPCVPASGTFSYGPVPCAAGSTCCSTGAACPASGICPTGLSRPLNSACSTDTDCAAGLTCQDRLALGQPTCG